MNHAQKASDLMSLPHQQTTEDTQIRRPYSSMSTTSLASYTSESSNAAAIQTARPSSSAPTQPPAANPRIPLVTEPDLSLIDEGNSEADIEQNECVTFSYFCVGMRKKDGTQNCATASTSLAFAKSISSPSHQKDTPRSCASYRYCSPKTKRHAHLHAFARIHFQRVAGSCISNPSFSRFRSYFSPVF
jgi:hypothetical protein